MQTYWAQVVAGLEGLGKCVNSTELRKDFEQARGTAAVEEAEAKARNEEAEARELDACMGAFDDVLAALIPQEGGTDEQRRLALEDTLRDNGKRKLLEQCQSQTGGKEKGSSCRQRRQETARQIARKTKQARKEAKRVRKSKSVTLKRTKVFHPGGAGRQKEKE